MRLLNIKTRSCIYTILVNAVSLLYCILLELNIWDRWSIKQVSPCLFMQSQPHLFSVDEDCLLLAHSIFTLIEPICSNSLFYSPCSVSGTEVSFYLASCQSIYSHQFRPGVLCIHTIVVWSNRVIIIVNQFLCKEGIEILLLVVSVCVCSTSLCALTVRIPSVNNEQSQQTSSDPHWPVHHS
jgi:hypothetical protein